MARNLLVSSILSGCLLIVGQGCSGDQIVRGPAKGKVTLAGQPLTNATILFENKSAGLALLMNLGPDGGYEMKNYKANGLPVGSYRIAITPGILRDGSQPPWEAMAMEAMTKATPVPTNIPAKYHSTATSGFSVEVKQGENPPFNFDLEATR